MKTTFTALHTHRSLPVFPLTVLYRQPRWSLRGPVQRGDVRPVQVCLRQPTGRPVSVLAPVQLSKAAQTIATGYNTKRDLKVAPLFLQKTLNSHNTKISLATSRGYFWKKRKRYDAWLRQWFNIKRNNINVERIVSLT